MVYDVTKQHTFDWCREEALKLESWGAKRYIFVGNKSDGQIDVDVKDSEAWLKSNGIINHYVCATNNVGTQELFIDMDNI